MPDNRKILIFSDTHLTDKPDQRKLDFLLSIISNADTVIINGEFWDSHMTTAKHFTQSSFWQPLFQLLKDKEARYIYGNHDSKAANAGYESLFSTQQANQYTVSQAGKTFHIEHGNQIAPDLDEVHPNMPWLMLKVGTLLDGLATRLFGRAFLVHYKKWNNRMKNWQRAHLDSDTYLVTGHSHYAELNNNEHFANSGSIRGTHASYLTIERGIIGLHCSRY